jgi:HSP20 family protein
MFHQVQMVSVMTTDRVTQRPAVRWLPAEPFAHFEDIHRRMNQLMRELTTPSVPGERWTPAVDIEETDDEFVIEVDLPGATAGDVILEWTDRSLTVRGRIPARKHTGVLHQHTRRTGPLCHTIALPGRVLGDTIVATLTHGVLAIHATKAQPGPSRRIYIVDPDAPEGRQP